jgi:hypothetical protein
MGQESSRHSSVSQTKPAGAAVSHSIRKVSHFGIVIFPSKFIESIFLTRSLIVPLQFKETPFSHAQMDAADLKDFVFVMVLLVF